MCGNPFNIGDKVGGDFEVEKATTHFINIDPTKLPINLKWREEEPGLEVLTLDEILEQITKKDYKNYKRYKLLGKVPFIRVNYESGMWGVIFEVGQYLDAGKQWYVHGVTKGYG